MSGNPAYSSLAQKTPPRAGPCPWLPWLASLHAAWQGAGKSGSVPRQLWRASPPLEPRTGILALRHVNPCPKPCCSLTTQALQLLLQGPLCLAVLGLWHFLVRLTLRLNAGLTQTLELQRCSFVKLLPKRPRSPNEIASSNTRPPFPSPRCIRSPHLLLALQLASQAGSSSAVFIVLCLQQSLMVAQVPSVTGSRRRLRAKARSRGRPALHQCRWGCQAWLCLWRRADLPLQTDPGCHLPQRSLW